MDPRAFSYGGDPLQLVSIILWTTVDVAGLIAALVLLFNSERLRRPALLVAIALGLSLFSRWGWFLYFRWVSSTNAAWAAEQQNVAVAFHWGSFAFDKSALISKCMLIVAAFVGVRAVATQGTSLPTPDAHFPRTSPTAAHYGSTALAQPLPPISKGARLAGIIVSSILAWAFVAVGFVLVQDRRTVDAGMLVTALSFVPVVVVIVLTLTTFHALWKSIAAPPVGCGIPGFARTTPGKAVGFLFIPLFSFYWCFQVIPGFATDANRTLDALGLRNARVSRGLGIAWCVCSILAIIPFVGLVISLAGLVIVPMFLSGAIDAANAIRSAPLQGEATATASPSSSRAIR